MNSDSMRLTSRGGELFDVQGRRVLLRGVNTGGQAKLPPYLPFDFDAGGFAEALKVYVDRLVDWGLNVARVPFTWDALEPERGQWDEAYLERYARLCEAIGERGIRVIVDFHQDVFARPWCGDGFPLWAMPPGEPGPRPDPHFWFLGYIQHAGVKAAYDRFWANEDGLRDAFREMWTRVATRLWPVPGVIGFEIINEPGWGTADATVWAREVLTPFYTELAAMVSELAPGALVFFDSTGAEALSGKTFLERPEGENLVFAPHWYEGTVIMAGSWNGRGDPTSGIPKWAEQGREWAVPVLLGEFGIPTRCEGAARYVRAQYEALDRCLMHGTLWEYSECERDWNGEGMSIVSVAGEETANVEAMVRPYPRATSGRPLRFEWDPEAGRGVLELEAEAGCTEFALPARLAEAAELRCEGVEGEATLSAGVLRVEHGAGRGTLTFETR